MQLKQSGHFELTFNSKKDRKLNAISSAVLTAISSAFLIMPSSIVAQQCDVSSDPRACHCQSSILSFPNNALNAIDGKIPVLLEADNVEADGEDSVSLSGDAFVAQGRQSISGGVITYSRETDQINASGGVKLRSVAGDSIEADSVALDVNRKIGVAENARFKLAERGEITQETNAVAIQSRGTASKISLEGEQFVRMEDVKYTTCADGNDAFFIKAGALEIDQATGIGKAKNASLVFKGVPLMYVPTLTFPINDQRKSGFLFPSFGTDSESGFIIEAPWYWNIAPNVDATIIPRLFTDRGVQLGLEVRHKTEMGETLFYGEHLPSDDEYGDDRTLISVRHDSDLTENLSLDVDYNDVSDTRYFEDFDSEAGIFSTRYVPRNAKLGYNAKYWDASVGFSDIEVVDDSVATSSQVFERSPEILFSTDLPKLGLTQFNLKGSRTDFSVGSQLVDLNEEDIDEGVRTVLRPSVSVPLEKVWGYVTPGLEINHVSYDLDNRDVDSRTTPIFTVDSGLYLEKDTTYLGENATQTLEPRVFFVSSDVDESDVSEVDFDTESLQFNNFSNLFSSTGFTGDDQVADNQQVTLAVTTRIFDENGNQKLKGGIGQAFYSDDREFTFVDNGVTSTELRSKSDILGELTLDLGNDWEVETFLQYDTEDGGLRTTNLSARYEKSAAKYFEVGYRNSEIDSSIDQLTLEGEWPINDRWSVFGIERYGIEESENLQTRLGFEYDGCCWRLRVAADSLTRTDGESRNAVFAEFELSGIGKVNTSSGL